MIAKPFASFLVDTLPADSNYLPLSTDDLATLVTIIGDDPEGIPLVISAYGVPLEEVVATNACGTILIERAQGQTTAQRFPRGSEVRFCYNSYTFITWMICNHNCCDDECPCEPVTVAAFAPQEATVGLPWETTAVFSGDLPIALAANEGTMPSWMNAEYGSRSIRLHGTPEATGTWSVSVSATNCSGANIVSEAATVSVVEAG